MRARAASGLAALVLLLCVLSGRAAAAPAYEHYVAGDLTTPSPERPRPGLLLNGGGDWPPSAFRWFAARAGHGHVVILRASGAGEAGEQMFRDVGGLTSVETFVVHDRAASDDPLLLAALDRADGVFIAGGDQANYVRFWRGTAVARALDRHVARGRPLGGTSAGLAILGSIAYGALDGGSIGSGEALRDPLGPAVTLVHDFLHLPLLRHVVIDSHFRVRDRLGRLIAFVAKARATIDPAAWGFGVDEAAALCVEGDGVATLHAPRGGFAWLIRPTGRMPLRRGRPLDAVSVRVVGVGPASRLDLRTLAVVRPAFVGAAQVRGGRLVISSAVPR